MIESLRDTYCTPRLVTDRLPRGVLTDPCSNPRSTVPAIEHVMLPRWRDQHFGPKPDRITWGDGTEIDWEGKTIFCNGPFSWLDPFAIKSVEAKDFCYLCHVDPTTRWWRYMTIRKGWLFTFRDRLAYDVPPGIEESKDDQPSCLIMSSGFRELCGSAFDSLGQWWQRH